MFASILVASVVSMASKASVAGQPSKGVSLSSSLGLCFCFEVRLHLSSNYSLDNQIHQTCSFCHHWSGHTLHHTSIRVCISTVETVYRNFVGRQSRHTPHNGLFPRSGYSSLPHQNRIQEYCWHHHRVHSLWSQGKDTWRSLKGKYVENGSKKRGGNWYLSFPCSWDPSRRNHGKNAYWLCHNTAYCCSHIQVRSSDPHIYLSIWELLGWQLHMLSSFWPPKQISYYHGICIVGKHWCKLWVSSSLHCQNCKPDYSIRHDKTHHRGLGLTGKNIYAAEKFGLKTSIP